MPDGRWRSAWPVRRTSPPVDTAFDDGHFLRTHILRPTWHYVAASDLWWLMRQVVLGSTRPHPPYELSAWTPAA